MASLLSGPIPQHPMYSKGGVNEPSPHAASRVRPEASSFASHGKNGTIANVFEITGTSCFSSSNYIPKNMSKDHVSENVRRMRQIQRKCKQKQREEETSAPIPVKALWKSQKYESVPSKLAQLLQKEPENPRPRSADFLRAHSRTGIPLTPKAPRPQSSHTPRRPSKSDVDNRQELSLKANNQPIRSASCSDLSAVGKSMNFIKVNALAASRQQVKRPPSQASLDESLNIKAERYSEYKRNVRGSVPKYLEKRKEEWRQEEMERLRNIPDPDMPAGHKQMPTEERLETLKILQQSHKELSRKLASLPIRSDTLRVRSAKEQLETKLCEVEEAMKIFSRPKVFVKVDG